MRLASLGAPLGAPLGAAFVSTVTANRAMAHMQLKNWGYVISDCKLALSFNASNIKAIFRLSKAHQARQEWEVALEVAEKGLSLPNEDKNKDLLKVVKEVGKNATLARVQRQKKEVSCAAHCALKTLCVGFTI